MPFGAYVAPGLIIPLAAVAIGAFQIPDTGAFTFATISLAVHGSYLTGFRQSLLLSVLASVIPGIFGLLVAYAIFTARRATLLRQIVITASGVVQGGPMTAAQVREFAAHPYAADAVRVRRWDDLVKDPAAATPDFPHFRPVLRSLLGEQ